MAGFDAFGDLMRPPKTPELDRMSGVTGESQKIGDFLDWLHENYQESPVCELPHPDKLLHEYFEIDADKVEHERRELLAYQRLLNAWRDTREELLLSDPDKPESVKHVPAPGELYEILVVGMGRSEPRKEWLKEAIDAVFAGQEPPQPV